MSLPRRLWRLARHGIRSVPGYVTDLTDELRARLDAERELQEFLGGASAAEAPPPSSPPPHPMARQYAILNVPVGADIPTVEKAWRRLVLEHHPDRHNSSPAAERAATERLRQINQAHDELIAWLREQA